MRRSVDSRMIFAYLLLLRDKTKRITAICGKITLSLFIPEEGVWDLISANPSL